MFWKKTKRINELELEVAVLRSENEVLQTRMNTSAEALKEAERVIFNMRDVLIGVFDQNK